MTFLAITVTWVLLGFVYCNALEWVIHRYVLHGLGKNKKSFWFFHWKHHKESRKHKFKDNRCSGTPFYKDKEFLGVILLLIAHSPTLWVAPAFFITLTWRALDYYRVHTKSHKSEEWAKNYVPWHWDHHMGPREAVEANWCVTLPLFDYIMGTRVKYYGTTKYYLDLAKKSNRELRKMKDGKDSKRMERICQRSGKNKNLLSEDKDRCKKAGGCGCGY
jgi:sterol desaturase/sphingolipid hydroxylase (fatty acid hydroxylase superfamily)